MMRRLFALLLIFGLLLCAVPVLGTASAETEAFRLDQDAVLYGMGSRSWARGYAPEERNGAWTGYFPVASDRAVGELTAWLEPEREALSPFLPQNMQVKLRPNAEGLWPLRLCYRLYGDRINGDYPARLYLEGQDAEGQPLQTELPLVVRIRGGQDDPAPVTAELRLLDAALTQGEPGSCTLLVRNTSDRAELTELTLSYAESAGELLPAETDSLRLEKLLPGREQSVTLPITVPAEARPGAHQLRVRLSYRSLRGEGSAEALLTVPVTQTLRLEHGPVTLADTVIRGESAGISVELMNLGTNEVKNLRMTLDLGDFVRDQTVLVGNLPGGESVTGKLAFSTAAAPLGSAEGRLTVVYEDASRNEASFSEPLRITVEAPAPIPVPATEQKDEGRTVPLWLLLAACGFLLAALLLQGLLLRSRLHKLEEERL